MREKEIGASLESAAGFVEDAMEDLREGRLEELDLNIWRALESIEYAAFLLSLEEISFPEKKTRLKSEKGQGDKALLTNTSDLLREGVKIAGLGSEARNLSRCVWNARRILLWVERNRSGRS